MPRSRPAGCGRALSPTSTTATTGTSPRRCTGTARKRSPTTSSRRPTSSPRTRRCTWTGSARWRRWARRWCACRTHRAPIPTRPSASTARTCCRRFAGRLAAHMGGLRLEGKTVLLTGATGGIGEAIARALHGRGATVVLSGRRAEVLERLRDELGSRAEVQQADLTERSDVERLAGRAAEVDVLVGNAALPASGRLDQFSPEELDRALDVNLRAQLQLARAASIAMVDRGAGHMVFVSSLSGKVATPGSALYSATKFGLRGMAAGLREDMAPHGIGVTTVFPGFIRDAGMFAEADVELPRGVGTRTPDEVAAAVVRGIEQGKDELDVAPLAMLLGTALSSIAPVTLAKIQRRLPSSKLSAEIAEGQANKR